MSTLNPTTMIITSRPATGRSVRLTRRGRVVVFLFCVAVLLGVGFALAGGSMATAERGSAEPTEIITVGTGQTLWDIAAELSDDGDVREEMRHIERLNALDSTMLVAGQRLAVPTS
ncbi:LysM peptidoglycan-binding domain-containing protein [Nocardioides sp. dk4132]|uniref:LysM peptidoglycan-binding domain-containing protein n=1 Tax=unclassified Nocardioides TaxID=2615069 RepID=UPI00129613D3|nr:MULTISPECIES: LysM peptidoglycan-binding domain-containing protein [unclassified Nocardioides]MQW76082.1 LysM peptidoglycan-binding domain-containing protein [Nocardioides sp. dk4132]QGA08929.1 LysM peptidoglycan-binding domain-containing protein [Nocardioides sp. dk884]